MISRSAIFLVEQIPDMGRVFGVNSQLLRIVRGGTRRAPPRSPRLARAGKDTSYTRRLQTSAASPAKPSHHGHEGQPQHIHFSGRPRRKEVRDGKVPTFPLRGKVNLRTSSFLLWVSFVA